MPYVLETATSRDKPNAASQAANTSIIMGIMLIRVMLMLRVVILTNTNNDRISPSRHNRDDIRCDRYRSIPSREIINARIMFIRVKDMLTTVK